MVALAVVLPLYLVFWSGPVRPMTLTEIAYQTCGSCGLTTAEIDGLIDTARHSTLSRQENLDLFHDTFEQHEDAELCLDCAEAVLNVSAD